MRNPNQVILSPIISEKGSLLKESNTYLFKVLPRANRIEVKNAVEELFKVQVLKVNILSVKGKNKGNFGRKRGKTSGYKKAFVRLLAGQKIEQIEGMF